MSPTRSRLRLIVPVLALSLLAAACGSSGSDSPKSTGTSGTGSGPALSGKINLVAYSTPQQAYADLIKAFNATAEGKNVSFSQSFGGSGDQSRAVAAGQPADVVEFSLEPDITRLVKANMVAADWNSGQYKGMVTDSVTVFAVRKGNPKNIKTWDDLIKPGVEVITPNPFQSGGAQWNIMAAWGAQIDAGKTEAQATQYLKELFKNVPVQDDSARKALQTFTGGKGDVMLAYENEAIFAQQRASPRLRRARPDDPDREPGGGDVDRQEPDGGQGLRDFLYTPAAQAIFLKNGYRPIVKGIPGADKFPTPSGLFDITEVRRLDCGQDQVLRPRQGHHEGRRGQRRSLHRWTDALAEPHRVGPSAGEAPGPVATSKPQGHRDRARARHHLPEPARAHPAGRGRLALAPTSRWSGASGTTYHARTPGRAEAHARRVGVVVAVINVVMGTLIAWVLVRDNFVGKRVIDALIDLPFALPTIVAGLVLLALYGPHSPLHVNLAYTRAGVVVALLFVTLPFVVRTVQPVLLELDREMEEAAASLGASNLTIFRRIVLPNLCPAIAAGAALSFARAISEFGSTVLISGNLPFKTAGRRGPHLRPDRERQHHIGGGHVDGVARGRARGALRDRSPAALGGAPWLSGSCG